ncbi:MAG: efflux RND transporter permease subunit, partial [bacterium]|nr:efflux RND transporter permease subunit [bacterium]
MEKKQSFAEKLVSCAFSNYVIFFLVILITSVMGTMSFFSMSRNVYPDMTIPIFTIVTENEVMAPEEIETSVTIPIESAMNGLPGVRRVRSQTSQGLSSVVVEFDISCDFWRSRQF